MIQNTLTVTLKLKGPFLTRESGPGQFGFDAATARDAQKNRIIPESLIKGRLAEAYAELRGIAPQHFISNAAFLLFGEQTGRAEHGNPIPPNPAHRGRLTITDFTLASTATPLRDARHRIAINDELGSVEKGALFVAEDAFGSGAEIIGKGKISYLTNDDTAGKAIARELELALRWIPQLGAGRTTGFGRLTDVSVVPAHIPVATVAATTAPHALAVAIRPDAPFCFAQHKIGGNLFESVPYIPGNAIKGALAEMCRALGRPLPAGFNDIRIRHAFPSSGEDRATIAPLSIAAVKQKLPNGKPETRFFDVASHIDAILLPGEDGSPTAPAFRVDWKSSDFPKCDAAFGWRQPNTTLRVRTAMDSAKRKSADGQLFSLELIVPDNIVWRTVVDLSGITDQTTRAKAAADLRVLFSTGLRYLGKTKATAGAKIVEEHPDKVAAPSPLGTTMRITLQSATLLADPRFPEKCEGRQSTGDALRDVYAAVFHNLSDESLELSHFFASQTLAGGNYLWQRFQKTSAKPGYRPWLLTEAGSVFILIVKDEVKARAKLADWLATGLPIPKWAVNEFTDNWRHNPYLPQNGFGEIAVNLRGTDINEPATKEITRA